jgi:hypothetical protein
MAGHTTIVSGALQLSNVLQHTYLQQRRTLHNLAAESWYKQMCCAASHAAANHDQKSRQNSERTALMTTLIAIGQKKKDVARVSACQVNLTPKTHGFHINKHQLELRSHAFCSHSSRYTP